MDELRTEHQQKKQLLRKASEFLACLDKGVDYNGAPDQVVMSPTQLMYTLVNCSLSASNMYAQSPDVDMLLPNAIKFSIKETSCYLGICLIVKREN